MLDIGSAGIWWCTAYDRVSFAEEADALAELDAQGWGAVWLPEHHGREVMAHSALALSATRRMPVVPGVANLWARDPTAMANGARTLAEAHPGRFALGLGVSHGQVARSRGNVDRYSPLQVVERYLDEMSHAQYLAARPPVEPPWILAALGPRMLTLAAARTAGAHTYTVPVEHTHLAREALGKDPLLAVEQKVVLSADAETARTIARKFLPLALPNYRNNLLRSGFTEADLADGGSDEAVDRLVAWGDPEAIRTRVEAHLSAGADHVCLQVLPTERHLPYQDWRALAEALVDNNDSRRT